MWPRGRNPHAQNLGDGSYPVILGFNQYPQQQQGQVVRLRAPSQNFNNKQKRDRLRPRQQGYSYYSDESLNSNYSYNAGNSRGSHSRGGGGIINAAMRNLPPKLPLNDRRSNTDAERERMPNRADDNRNQRERGSLQMNVNRSQNRLQPENEGESQQRIYICPKCGENFAYRHTHNKYIGKIPLILYCNHTVCQECIYQNLKNLKVNCPTCQKDSILTQEEAPVCQTDMQNIFPPNFYIIGVILYYKPQGGYLGNLDNIKFVPTSSRKQRPTLPNPTERCCFATCSKQATMYCPSCEGIYCLDCCTVVHKSTKKLMTHEPVLRRTQKFTLMLENCGEHSHMQVEFFCKTCDLTACCYCVLDKHTDHERVPLYHLNDSEMEEFKKLKKVAERALREVLYAQKKTARLTNFNTGSVKKDVSQYFANYHAKIEILEKKMYDELESFKINNRGLDGVQSSLMASAEQLKQLVSFNEEKIEDRKLNLRGALEKLRDIENIPRFLLNEDGSSEPVRFVVNETAMDTLEEDFVIEKCEDSEYRLVSEKELPKNYVVDLDESDSEVEENISNILSKSNQSEDMMSSESKTMDLPKMVSVSAANSTTSKKVQKHTKPNQPTKKKLEMERVDVQHINSMDSFFIQLKNNQSKLVQLNRDIENYVKMGGAEPVLQPQLNNLYLALYVTESQNQKEQRWCRARLTEIKTGESGPLYEMSFIDYGKTQIIDGSRVRDIPSFLAQKKPFAIECMLHNPMNVNWNKKAHLSLAKILNGKDVYMMVKSLNCGIHEVDLMIASSDGGVTSVTDILVHATNSVGPINDDNISLDGSVSLRKDGYYPSLRVFPNSKKFEKHQKERVVIANVVDPDNIFVHLMRHQEAFKNMNHYIKKAFKQAKANGCIPIEGTYVLVEYRDAIRSNWHRAFIKSVDLNSEKVHVLLVDWGINVMVATSNIRPLRESFTKLESQAVLVKLGHIAPYNRQATWSQHASHFLQAYHQSQDVLKMVVQDVDPRVQVALFDITSNVDICLNAMMVDGNLADSTGPLSTKVEWPQFEVNNPAFLEEEGLMASMLKKVDEDVNYDSEEEVGVDKKKLQLDVVKVEAPDVIWVKFLKFKERESAMVRDLQVHYSEEQKTKTEWKVNDQCVVEVDNEYGRGKILEEGKREYKVYLFDKVKEITVPLEQIYVYDKYFMMYPQVVTKSHLANIRPAGDTGKWSISSIEALQEIFSKHTRIYGNMALDSDLEPSNKSMPLNMWYGLVVQGGPLDPDILRYVSINNFLVKLGFAYKIPTPAVMPSTSKTSTSTATRSPTPSKSTASPIKTAKNGEDLLKILTGESIESINEELISEEGKETGSTSATISEQEKNEEVQSDAETVVNFSRKAKNKSRSPRKDCSSAAQRMEILESLNEPSSVREKRASTKKTTKPIKLNLEKGKDDKNNMTEEQPSKSTEQNEETKSRTNREQKIIDHNEDPIKNWNALVEQELGELSTKPKTLENLDLSGDAEDEAKNNDEVNIIEGAGDEDEGSPYHKCEVVIDDWMPPFRFTTKEFQARVTCVETSGHLYIHEKNMEDVYRKMEANIKEYFDSNPPEFCDHQWEPGHLCTIKYTDGKWYRGKILKIKNSKEISVFMIDFGSDHDLSPDVLFREVLYTDIGSFATKVKLDKVFTKSGSWLSSDYDHFHELVTDWCRIVVKGPLDVDLPLVEVYNEYGVFVNQKLLELCPNLSRCSNFPIEQGIDDEDTVVIESIESEESFDKEMLMDTFNEELDKRTSVEEVSPSKKSRTNLRYKKLPIPEKLLEGKKVLLEIGGVLNYDKVALKTPGDVSDEMYHLVMDIQDVVDSFPILKDIKIGMPCLTPYSEDGVWYRARISGTQAVDLGFVDVFFVDYGNSEAVPLKKLRQITPEYLKVPQQTWEAALNIVLKEDSDVISVTRLINSLDRQERYIQLVKEEPLTVDIYNQDGKLSYETLIECGAIKTFESD